MTETNPVLTDLAARRASRGAATYTARELANLLAININSVYAESSAGRIPCLRFGKRYVWPREAVNAWLRTAGGKVDAA